MSKNKHEDAKDLLNNYIEKIEENQKKKHEDREDKIFLEKLEMDRLQEQNLELEDIKKELKQAKVDQARIDIEKVRMEREMTKQTEKNYHLLVKDEIWPFSHGEFMENARRDMKDDLRREFKALME